MKRHALHILMCLPMVLVAILLVAGGVGALALVPVLVCAVMMGAMMSVAAGFGRNRGGDGR